MNKGTIFNYWLCADPFLEKPGNAHICCWCQHQILLYFKALHRVAYFKYTRYKIHLLFTLTLINSFKFLRLNFSGRWCVKVSFCVLTLLVIFIMAPLIIIKGKMQMKWKIIFKRLLHYWYGVFHKEDKGLKWNLGRY